MDASNNVPLTLKFYNHLKGDRQTSIAEFVFRVLEKDEESINRGGYYFWDPLAAVILSKEELATFQDIPLLIIQKKGQDCGRTLEREDGNQIRVALNADRLRFKKLFFDVQNSYTFALH